MKLHVMPVYVEDLLSDATVDLMDAAAFGAYMRLLFYSWKEVGLPNDPDRLRRLARVDNGRAWERIWTLLATKWTTIEDPTRGQRLVNEKQEDVRRNVNAYRTAQSNRAKKRYSPDAEALPARTASVSVSESVSVSDPIVSSRTKKPKVDPLPFKVQEALETLARCNRFAWPEEPEAKDWKHLTGIIRLTKTPDALARVVGWLASHELQRDAITVAVLRSNVGAWLTDSKRNNGCPSFTARRGPQPTGVVVDTTGQLAIPDTLLPPEGDED